MNSPALDAAELVNWRRELRAFVETEILPNAISWEQTRKFPSDFLKEFGKKGWLGLSLPLEHGGKGQSLWWEVVLAEELALSHALGWALSIMVQTNVVAPLLSNLGSDILIKSVLRPALQGHGYLALAATEPLSGSDIVSTATTAELDGAEYVLNGEKKYITNGSVAKHLVVLVRLRSGHSPWTLGLLVVDANTRGIHREKLPTIGLKTGDTAEIRFNDVRVSKDNMIGAAGRGFPLLLKSLQRERLIGAVSLNALAQHALNETSAFLRTRQRPDGPLSQKQAIRHRLATLQARVEAARQFTYATCQAYANQQPCDKEIIMLKMISYETCQEVIRECAQLFGGTAFIETHWMAHAVQDSQSFTLAAGTSEIMRELLSGMMGI